MKKYDKIGVGVLSYSRPDYYEQVISRIPRHRIDRLIVVNDGKNQYVKPKDGIDRIVYTKKQAGVSVCKNLILDYLIEEGIEHIFLVEDDILIQDENVFDAYIENANTFGIHHLTFEKIAGNEETKKFEYISPNGCALSFMHSPQGAFMYLNAAIIKKIGKFDEKMFCAFEHIDLAYNLYKKNVYTPFWMFPDLLNSEKYLKPIEGSSEKSTITNIGQYKKNWEDAANVFIQKHGIFTNQIQHPTLQDLADSLMHLESTYSRKKLCNKGKKLSVVIPYRDRQESLDELIPKLKEYLDKQVDDYEILLVEQEDNKPFNKGLLNNIGFKLCKGDWVCLHDVDLVPEFSDYSYPKKPSHLSTFCSQFQYIENPDATMGGVITFTREHFEKVNGYSNECIFWGRDDTELAARCESAGLGIYKHPFGKYYSVPHPHRLDNSEEKEGHEENSKRFEEKWKKNDNYLKDGLSNLKLFDFVIGSESKEFYTHIKVKKK